MFNVLPFEVFTATEFVVGTKAACAGKALKDIDIDDDAFKSIEAIILSMTPKERTHPELLNTSRRNRIARGSGTDVQAVNRLIKQFEQMRKMMKMVTGSKMGQMMARMPRR